MHGLGNIFLWIGILVGFVGVALVLKEKDAKADEEDVWGCGHKVGLILK